MADNKSFRQFEKVLSKIRNIEEFAATFFNALVEDLNSTLQNLSLSRNFSGETFEGIEIEATTTKRVFHKLGVIPNFRLIVRQSGGGLITDGEFAKNYVDLYNSGATTATISVILLKE